MRRTLWHFQYPQSRVVGCYDGDHRFRGEVIYDFQYPQSRVVGCYAHQRRVARSAWTTFSTLRVGSLVATLLDAVLHLANQSFSTLRVGSLVATSPPSSDTHNALPAFSTLRVGSLVATDRDGCQAVLGHGFQYPQSRVVGCYLAGHGDSDSQQRFQYPQSRVVGCYRHAGAATGGGHFSFSTLRVGSLVATTNPFQRLPVSEAFSTLRVGSLVAT